MVEMVLNASGGGNVFTTCSMIDYRTASRSLKLEVNISLCLNSVSSLRMFQIMSAVACSRIRVTNRPHMFSVELLSCENS